MIELEVGLDTQALDSFQTLVEVVEKLRGPNGCPWDKEQTHQTLTRFAIEEAHELAEAIDSGNLNHIKEELGDLLLQVVLHSEIARQDGSFTLKDVIEEISEKMVRRHPHVFGENRLSSSEEVKKQWTKIKSEERQKPQDSFNLPAGVPALLAAQKIGEKTKQFDFDFADLNQSFEKVKEELQELEEAIKSNDKGHIEHELGDLFFSASQLARFVSLDAEQVARKANQRFERRFFKMQKLAEGDFVTLPASEKERLWKAAKKATE